MDHEESENSLISKALRISEGNSFRASLLHVYLMLFPSQIPFKSVEGLRAVYRSYYPYQVRKLLPVQRREAFERPERQGLWKDTVSKYQFDTAQSRRPPRVTIEG